MKRSNLMTIILPFMMAAIVVACGGNGGVAGIGGSGFVASGSVTGFGSVFVNGVEFETNSAIFDIDGTSGTQADLAIGMQVRINGSINSDGVTGMATSISFDDQLQGPVANLSLPDADGTKRTFNIFGITGITVSVDSVDTVFDVSDSNMGIAFDFDTIANNNNVEISGFFDTAGVLHATRVELEDVTFGTASIVEVKGLIVGLSGTTFTVNGVIVDASALMIIDNLPNGLEEGAFVEVKGTYDVPTNTITATRVEGEDNNLEDTNKVSVEGIITNFVDNNSDFKVSNVSVNASGAVLLPSTMILKNDLRVEVEGPVINGIIQATTVELRGGNAKVHAKVTSLGVGSNFIVEPVVGSGETIAITVTTATELEDPVAVGEFVRVRGFEDSGGVTATRVEVRSSDDDVIVQGNATAASGNAGAGGDITVLGVKFLFDSTAGGTTDFEDENDLPMTTTEINAFLSSIATAPRLVKVKDEESGSGGSNAVGTADEIDLETP